MVGTSEIPIKTLVGTAGIRPKPIPSRTMVGTAEISIKTLGMKFNDNINQIIMNKVKPNELY